MSKPNELKSNANGASCPSRCYPTDSPPWKPCLRRYFFVRRHRLWGWAICWHQWHPYSKTWGMSWGMGFKDIREAKAIRKFLNARVQRGINYGVSFEDVVLFVQAGSPNPDCPRIVG